MTARDIVMSAAGNAGDGKTYIEDVFSTYLYTGTGSAQTITNGIDLAGKGGMVWLKGRGNTSWHGLFDTVRGQNSLATNSTEGQGSTGTSGITSFNSDGFTNGSTSWWGGSNEGSGVNHVSWTFRKAPKFFDVVTYTGNSATQTINHSLGQVPGMIIVKNTSSSTGAWCVYHKDVGATEALVLNTTATPTTSTNFWNNTAPTSTTFSVGSASATNGNGNTMVAYLFAHDTTTDGLIQCGSFTTDASGNATVNLGWEPQYVLYRRVSSTDSWAVMDSMRGMSTTGFNILYANASSSENINTSTTLKFAVPTATGMSFSNQYTSASFIYMAIRRPMKVPTDGTKVFKPIAQTASSPTTVTTGFPVDLALHRSRTSMSSTDFFDRLRGSTAGLFSDGTYAEYGYTSGSKTSFDSNTSITENLQSASSIYWNFKRAPGFFDVVCYTGNSTTKNVNHSLGVVPELMIVKARNNSSAEWCVYSSSLGNKGLLFLNQNWQGYTGSELVWNSTTPTSTVFSVNEDGSSYTNGSGYNYVAYLFASCPGVSKVGSYTGNGSSQTINCGFSAGARFVLIKRTDSTGDWYVWDTARGIVASNDPHLSLNTASAEVTTDDTIDPDSTGFVVNQVSATNVNVSGGSYIYLAIA